MNRKQIEAVVFDVGGTLVRPTRPPGETYAEVARRYGQDWDPAAVQAGFKRAFALAAPRARGDVPDDGDDRARWRWIVESSLAEMGAPPDFPWTAYFEELYALFARPEMWSVFPETRSVLEELRCRGLTLALLSNWDARIHPMLEGLELGDYFTHRFISAEMGCEKPDRLIYEKAEAALGVAPGKILMVGDDPEKDDAMPRRLGWQALLLNRPGVTLTALL